MIDPNTWTGERLETFVYNDTTFEHLHRYAIVLQLSSGKKVLDIACGEGYGSNLMAVGATEVVGVDIAQETIDIAREKYQRQNLRFLQGSADAIPCEKDYFDVVVSFETIEHHDRHHEMMQEIKRVLKKDGLLVISSPDKKFYSEKPGGYQNPYHVKELYKEEFQHLLSQYFTHIQMLSQSSFIGSVVLADDATEPIAKVYEGNYHHITQSAWEPPYCVAIAADVVAAPLAGSFFKSTDVLEERMQKAEREMYNTMAKQITDFVTFQVTERVTKEVTDYVTHQVTLQATADTVERMQRSKPYKVGAAVLKPFQYLNQIFKSRP